MPDIVLTVFGVGFLLLCVSLLPALASRIQLPLTVLLAVFGGLLGLAVHGLPDASATGDVLSALRSFNLSSAAFIYVFLPTLLFEMGLALDVRRLLDDIVPVLLLAVVAVVVCTAVVGLALGAVSDMSLVACLLLGSIVATTDPAAVVSIFRDLGAPRRLSILVEGESLLNDAAAISLFSLLIAILAGGREPDAAATVLAFARTFAGGAAVGWAAATLACSLVRVLSGNRVAEITLTVALAYLSFVLAERTFGVSGVVAVVVASLVIGSKGRTRIAPKTWDGLVDTWGQLGFWANSLVFILAAMRAPLLLEGAAPSEVLLVGVVFLATLLARLVVLFGMLPALVALKLANKVSAPYAAVIAWGGLRGAVSLALALAVFENAALPADVRRFVAAMVTGFVLSTLLVNGLTLKPLIKLLRLDRLSPADRAVRDRALFLAYSAMREKIAAAAEAESIEPALAASVSDEVAARIGCVSAAEDGDAGLSAEDRVYIGLLTVAARGRELVLERFREGILTRPVVDGLLAQNGRLADGAKTGGREGYEAAARRGLEFGRELKAALFLHRRFGFTPWLASALSVRFETFLAEKALVRELIAFNCEKIVPLLGDAPAKDLGAILAARLEGISRSIAAMELQFPEYARTLEVNYLNRVALRLEDETYGGMLSQSVITREVFGDLERRVAGRRSEVGRRPKLDVALRPEDLVARVPMFEGLSKERLEGIARPLKARFTLPGERIIERGAKGDSMYFIASGAVEVKVAPHPVQLGSGEFFGELALLTKKPRVADVVALGYCRLLVLTARDFETLLDADAGLRARIDEVARKRLG